ncbi:MAG: 3-isopropylmalate dehydratase small subunit [Acidimicrobiia bacterium]
MKPVRRVQGGVVALPRPDIDTDQIIPQRYLKRIERSGYGEFLFYDWAHDESGTPNPSFVLNDSARSTAKVLVAGPNFGCGSSREHAVWAIQDRGFEAVVATSLADIFRENAINIGLLPIEASQEVVERLMEIAADPEAEVIIDLEEQTIYGPDLQARFTIDATARERLLAGLDLIGATLQLQESIATYEADRPAWLPSLGA